MSITRKDIGEYQDQVFARKLRICKWLGMSSVDVFELNDADPNVHGLVEVTWRSAAMERPTHGALIGVGVVGDAEQTVHTGTLRLDPVDAAAMREVAGPRPVFPVNSHIHGMTAGRDWDRYDGLIDEVEVGDDGDGLPLRTERVARVAGAPIKAGDRLEVREDGRVYPVSEERRP